MFQFHCQIQQGIAFDPQFLQHIMTGLLDDFCPWVVVLIHSVAETHQLGVVLLVLNVDQELLDIVDMTNLGKHL